MSMERDRGFESLRNATRGNAEATAIVVKGYANGASAESTALEVIESGAVATSEPALAACYRDSVKLQGEFASLGEFLAFKRAEASGRVHMRY